MLNVGQYIFLTSQVLAALQMLRLFTREKFVKISQENLTAACSFMVLSAYIFLTWKFVVSDFSYALIYKQSNTLKPLLYKITGLWANHEGSMLLFIFILSLYNFAYAVLSRFPRKEEVLGFQGALIFFLISYTFFTSDPFSPTQLLNGQLPQQGLGMNPLLQDIGLAFHPPILYTGFAGFSLAFSIAMVVLRNKLTDKSFAEFSRPWVLFSWSSLSLGVALGSWWAYRELGWGGFWFWDPVENVSLLPWLFGTALIHLNYTTKKFNRFTFVTLLFSILTFLTALLGFFLVRSGILTSVHSFASDPTRGLVMLGIVFVISSYAMILYGKCLTELKFIPEGRMDFISREFGILLQIVLLAGMGITIMRGIIYPLVLDMFFDTKISVGEPYFNLTFIPISFMFIFLAVFAPILKWQKERLSTVVKKSFPSFVVSAVITIYLRIKFPDNISPIITISIFLCLWLFLSCVGLTITRMVKREKISKSFVSMMMAHGAFGLLGLAITLNIAFAEDTERLMKPGDKINFGGYDFTLRSSSIRKDSNFIAQTAKFEVAKENSIIALYPENRIYFPSFTKTHEADVHYGVMEDIYINIGESERSPDAKHKKVKAAMEDNQQGGYNSAEYAFPSRIYIKPFMFFIWFSVLVMAFGGFIAMLPKKK